ncbi:phosphatidylinositol kinase [Endozoicomonas montiporae]|uniref:Phosphatidylinositol kinase n=3 Tax=Endozoicomonas montiporae TaxID=1027273 RepID=A0A081N0U4_9GAMM|nr:serine/threonine-protein kinase [Endozoicomonas montiporae CL-33]KEQ12067.1 phosphatidylinositol kinase [Endozoicomonas montiporae]
MTSDVGYNEAFVWIWLPEATDPVVTGKLSRNGDRLLFNYGKSYLQRENAIALYDPELPLTSGNISLTQGLKMPGVIRDGSPDAWGRRVIINRKLGQSGRQVDTAHLDELTYLLESGSDRIGALDFQRSPTEYVPRIIASATLEELLHCAERVEKGLPVPAELDLALHHGTSIGGARPKALIEDSNRKFIAKFSSSSDIYPVVKGEFIAMRLARLAGLDVADVQMKAVEGKDVLLVERFDRQQTPKGWTRKPMVSALTLFGLDEMFARYASYETLADLIRLSFTDAPKTLKELFSRLVFNILCGNTDDHARNHAAFWDGEMLTLTPAYDICPQGRAGNIASQAMLISGDQRQSNLACCIEAAAVFQLSRTEATTIVDQLKEVIERHWQSVCDEARLSPVDRKLLWGRQFMNPYIFEAVQP